ncbi:hypothetical protein GQ53DRAFT_811720 [Thozetella sp. PMI_491]|nr:hypothetical protein GQ53DRAFT_811720 [Thozetella sp. PMI_491]
MPPSKAAAYEPLQEVALDRNRDAAEKGGALRSAGLWEHETWKTRKFRWLGTIQLINFGLELALFALLAAGFIALARARGSLAGGKPLGESGGVISLDTESALKQALRHSAASPTGPSQTIYQVDVFHSLQFLNAVCQQVMTESPPPVNEVHMLHYLDYIRYQLLCHPDLTLVTTNDLEDFVFDEVHTCRDYGAVLDWTVRHRRWSFLSG